MGKVSVVGAGMKSHPGVAAKVFTTLGDEGINIEMISTSPIKISCVVPRRRASPDAVRALHAAFELRAPTRSRPSTRSGSRGMTRMTATASPSSAPPAPSAPSCCAKLRERGFPAREIVPFASERSAGRELDGGSIVQPLTDETIQGFDLAIFSRRRRDLRRVGAALRRGRRRRRRQLLEVAHATPRSRSSSPRSTRTRSTATRA